MVELQPGTYDVLSVSDSDSTIWSLVTCKLVNFLFPYFSHLKSGDDNNSTHLGTLY
jgi:hypothetical protein